MQVEEGVVFLRKRQLDRNPLEQAHFAGADNLTFCQEMSWLKTRGRQRTDSTRILAAGRRLNRLERVGATLRAALNKLAQLTRACSRAATQQPGKVAVPR